MTDDEIIEMAVKCYLISPGNREGFYGDALIQFAKLVAEAEREACAKVADYYSMHDQDTPADIAEAIRARGNT